MTQQPFWMQSPNPEEQREIDKKLAARMGISLEELYEIDRQVAEDVRARDAIPREERAVDSNPKFNKGFGPDTPANHLAPGELRDYYDKAAGSSHEPQPPVDTGSRGGTPATPRPPGQSGYQAPFSPPGTSGDFAPAPPRATYDGWTRQSVFYLPVTLHGELVGYLWASTSHNSAGFARKIRPNTGPGFDPFADPSLWSADVWADRLAGAYQHGIPAQVAVRQWIGAPEHAQGGRISADAVEQHAVSLAALYEFVNPGSPPPPNPLIQDGMYPDGTPVDRSQDWGPLVSKPLPRYRTNTDAAVRFFPVTKDDAVIGYLWASLGGDAADYLPRFASGRAGEIAAGMWQLWLSRAYEEGLTPLQALDRCRYSPADRLSGVIGVEARAQELPNLAQLQDFARR